MDIMSILSLIAGGAQSIGTNVINALTQVLTTWMVNEANMSITDATNQANAEIQQAINAMNLQITEQTNQTNKDIQDAINEVNRQNVQETNALNQQMARELNEQNMNIFQQQFDYTKQVQAEQWRREDTMMQRQVADAKNAGLSPLAGLGLSNTGSSVSQPSAPKLENAYAQAPHAEATQFQKANLMGWKNERPQLLKYDIKLENLNDMLSTIYQNEMSMIKTDKTLNLEEKKLGFEETKTKLQLDATSTNLEKQIAATKDLAEQERLTKWNIHLDQFNLQKVQNDMDMLKAMTGGYTVSPRYYNNYDECLKAQNSWINGYSQAIDRAIEKYSKVTTTTTGLDAGANSSVGVAGLNAGLNAGVENQKTTKQDLSTFIEHEIRIYVMSTGGFPMLKAQ